MEASDLNDHPEDLWNTGEAMRKSVQGRISERTGEDRQSTDVLNMVHGLGEVIVIVAVGV